MASIDAAVYVVGYLGDHKSSSTAWGNSQPGYARPASDDK